MSQIGRDFKQLRRGIFISDKCNILQAFEQMIFVRAGNLDGWTTASVQLFFGLPLLPSAFKLSLSLISLSLSYICSWHFTAPDQAPNKDYSMAAFRSPVWERHSRHAFFVFGIKLVRSIYIYLY